MNTHRATLVRGSVYILGAKRFDKGVPVAVTEDEKRKLENDPASRKVTTEEGGQKVRETMPRFKFETIGASAAPAPVPVAGRRRPVPVKPPTPDEAGDETPREPEQV